MSDSCIYRLKKRREKMRVERKEERQHLPLISSVIITAVMSCGCTERNKTIPSLRSVFSACFSAERVREETSEEEVERESRMREKKEKVTARQTAKR